MKSADNEIIGLLNRIHDAQAGGGGGAPAFAEITGAPEDNAALDSALETKQTAAQVQALIDTTPGVRKSVAATAHGFVVGDVLRMDGTAYVKAQADSDVNAEAVGMVASVTDANNFILATGGFVSGLSGLTAGAMHFLSPTTAGAITATEPTADGQISKPVFIATTTTTGYFFNMRGSEVGVSAATGGVIGIARLALGSDIATVEYADGVFAELSGTTFGWETSTGTLTITYGAAQADANYKPSCEANYPNVSIRASVVSDTTLTFKFYDSAANTAAEPSTVWISAERRSQ